MVVSNCKSQTNKAHGKCTPCVRRLGAVHIKESCSFSEFTWSRNKSLGRYKELRSSQRRLGGIYDS